MKKIIATHNKMFHADEITAIALLKLFTSDEYKIERVDHNTLEFDKYDFVIDIGQKYDGLKYFDHHQYKGGKSSAGLIWEYLGVENQYEKISKLVDLVDMNDVGIAKSKEFEYSSLIKCYNNENLYSQEQDIQFTKALDFAINILSSKKRFHDSSLEAEKIIANSTFFEKNSKIIELDSFTPHWRMYINGQNMPNVKAVVWEDVLENNWKVNITSKFIGSFELTHIPLKQDFNMEFVHKSGHFAIANNKESLIKYLNSQIK